MRIYYGRGDSVSPPRVWVAGEGRLWELPADQHWRCPEHGHGWGEEVQGLNTAFSVLRDVLGKREDGLAAQLAPLYRSQILAKMGGGGWQADTEIVLRWVLETVLPYAWPISERVPQAAEGVPHDAPF